MPNGPKPTAMGEVTTAVGKITAKQESLLTNLVLANCTIAQNERHKCAKIKQCRPKLVQKRLSKTRQQRCNVILQPDLQPFFSIKTGQACFNSAPMKNLNRYFLIKNNKYHALILAIKLSEPSKFRRDFSKKHKTAASGNLHRGGMQLGFGSKWRMDFMDALA